MATLTLQQKDFLRSQKIPPSELFDASGMRKPDYAVAMRAAGQNFAYGVTPCAAAGHSLRTRAGHCIQCDTRKIAFQLRHRTPGHVYVAGSASTRLVKIGTTIDLQDREKKLSEYAYGGARDWEVLLSVHVENAGAVEFAAQDKLRGYEAEGTYRREGRVQGCYELFRCSYQDAKAALMSSVPPDGAVWIKDEARACAVWHT